MKLKIKILKEHILNGVCHSATKCMIALAIRGSIPQLRVDVGQICIQKGSEWACASELPKQAEMLRQRFDFIAENIFGEERLKYLQPFSFIIDVDETLLMPYSHLQRIKTIINNTNNITILS